jgi:hypothetical protein
MVAGELREKPRASGLRRSHEHAIAAATTAPSELLAGNTFGPTGAVTDA